MQKTSYEFRFYSPDGEYEYSIIDGFHSATFWVEENAIGSFYIDIPYTNLAKIRPFLREDEIIEIYRNEPNNKYLMFDKRWFLRLWRDKSDERGVKTLRLRGVDCNNLIDRRIIAYGEHEKDYTVIDSLYADDAIKRLARQNFGDLCVDSTRDWSDKILISSYTSRAPAIDMTGLQHRKLLPTLQEICDLVYSENDIELSFDMKWNPENQKYRFETFVNQMGVDRSIGTKTPIILTVSNDLNQPMRGGLSYASVTHDAIDTRTKVYCGGRNSGEEEIVKTAEDSDAIDRTPFGLWEDWENASNMDTHASIQSEANKRLMEWQPNDIINGHMENAFTDYLGRLFNWGDKIVFKYYSHVYDVNIRKIMIEILDNGSTKTTLFTRNMEEAYY